MDENLNQTPDTNEIEPVEETTDIAPENSTESVQNAQSGATESEAPAPIAPVTQPTNFNTTYYTQPVSTPYNAPAQNTVAYNSAPSNSAPYTTPAYNQPQQQNQSYYLPDSPLQNPVATYPQGPDADKKKSKKLGKRIFIILVCLSILVASIALGTNNKDNSNSNSNKDTGSTAEKPAVLDENVQSPSAEDSPISYSEYSGSGTMTPEQIYVSVKDINVGVLVYSKNQMISEGSGIIVGEDSTGKYTYIVTAAHVISKANTDDIQVQFSDESELDAEVVGFDAKTDIGVIKVKETGFKHAVFGNSNKLSVGQKVYAIGNPGGTEFFGSFTGGMISAIDRPVPTTNSTYDLPCIQHNAAINPGNSGGALVNEYGQVIGLNSAKISSTEYEGMGFAVPSDTLQEVYMQIVKYGYVTNRPMLGIQYYSVATDSTYSQIAWKNNLPFGSIVIASINEKSDLVNKGVEIGDIITAVNGKKLETTDVLLEAIENSSVGDTLKLTVYRLNSKGSVEKTFEVSVKLVEDKGDTVIVEETTEFDPFDIFGY